MTIRCDEMLGLRNKLTRAMFCSVVAGKKLDVFFTPRQAVDARWDPVVLVGMPLASAGTGVMPGTGFPPAGTGTGVTGGYG